MKRDSRLYPLSWNHRDLLVFADRVRMALTTDHPRYRFSPEALLDQAREFWRSVFLLHLEAETEILFECLETAGGHLKMERETILSEFKELAEIFKKVSASPPGEETKPLLVRFADLIIHHVRFEERELFPRAQEILSAGELNRIGEALTLKLPKVCRTPPD